MIWARALCLLVVGSALGLGYNAVRPDGVRLQAAPAQEICEAHASPPDELLPDEAAALCERGGVVIADARNSARYAEGHIADALHLPCDAAGKVASEALTHLAGARTVLVYGDSTEEARPVAAGLQQRIHDPSVRVVVLAGGFGAWAGRGLACASGPCLECKESR